MELIEDYGSDCLEVEVVNLDAQEMAEVLHLHSRIRSNIAQGRELGENPGPQPAARNMAYQLKSKDNDLRFLFSLDEPCGIITFLVSLFAGLLMACATISMNTVNRNEKIFQQLQDDADKKLPRKESVLDIRPAYNCIHKHLKQTDVFQEKAKRTLWKERLEIEIMNSRISCINKLLRPEAPESEWRKSRSPKVFCRGVNPVTV